MSKEPIQNAPMAKKEIEKCGDVKEVWALDRDRGKYQVSTNGLGLNVKGTSYGVSLSIEAFWEKDGNLISTVKLTA